jgi:hypothetical protein
MRIEGSVMVMYIAAMQIRATRRGVNRVVKRSACAARGRERFLVVDENSRIEAPVK